MSRESWCRVEHGGQVASVSVVSESSQSVSQSWVLRSVFHDGTTLNFVLTIWEVHWKSMMMEVEVQQTLRKKWKNNTSSCSYDATIVHTQPAEPTTRPSHEHDYSMAGIVARPTTNIFVNDRHASCALALAICTTQKGLAALCLSWLLLLKFVGCYVVVVVCSSFIICIATK